MVNRQHAHGKKAIFIGIFGVKLPFSGGNKPFFQSAVELIFTHEIDESFHVLGYKPTVLPGISLYPAGAQKRGTAVGLKRFFKATIRQSEVHITDTVIPDILVVVGAAFEVPIVVCFAEFFSHLANRPIVVSVFQGIGGWAIFIGYKSEFQVFVEPSVAGETAPTVRDALFGLVVFHGGIGVFRVIIFMNTLLEGTDDQFDFMRSHHDTGILQSFRTFTKPAAFVVKFEQRGHPFIGKVGGCQGPHLVEIPESIPEGISPIHGQIRIFELLYFFIHVHVFSIYIAVDGASDIHSVEIGVELFFIDLVFALYFDHLEQIVPNFTGIVVHCIKVPAEGLGDFSIKVESCLFAADKRDAGLHENLFVFFGFKMHKSTKIGMIPT